MPFEMLRNLFSRDASEAAAPPIPEKPPQPVPEILQETKAGPSNEPIFFRIWGQQHERLNIPKKGLPVVTNEDAAFLVRHLTRYEAALGIREVLQEGIPEHVAKSDKEVLTRLVALEEGIAYGTAVERLKPQLSDEPGSKPELPSWDQDIALRFIQWVSSYHPLLVATFLYIHSCDQVAVGLLSFDAEEQYRFINDMYHWALEFDNDL